MPCNKVKLNRDDKCDLETAALYRQHLLSYPINATWSELDFCSEVADLVDIYETTIYGGPMGNSFQPLRKYLQER